MNRTPVIAVAALLLAACGTEPDTTDTTELTHVTNDYRDEIADRLANGPLEGGAGVWQANYEGAVVRYHLPATDEQQADAEEYRQAAGGGPVTWIGVEVDNREGLEPINLYSLIVVLDDGTQHTAVPAAQTIDEWTTDAMLAAKVPDDVLVEGQNLADSQQVYLLPGASGEFLMTADPFTPEQVRSVTAYPSGGVDQVEAFKR